jgi:tetratricopeptide (TPR) repeat protein
MTTVQYSTQSKEAIELVEKAILEILAWRGDPILTLNSAITADKSFGFPYVIQASLDILGTGVRGDDPKLNSILKNAGDRLDHANSREKQHFEAIKLCNEGRFEPALEIWDKLIAAQPWDVLALKFYSDVLFYVGRVNDLKVLCAKYLDEWNKHKCHPHYGYIMGIASFGYEEFGLYEEAAQLATIGLQCNPRDGWSAHTRAHVYEMENHAREGIEFMMARVNDWTHAVYLACHNYWHVSLYHIEYAEYEDALRLADTEVLRRACSSGALLDMVDASSILLRLEFQEINVGLDRWQKVYQTWEPHFNDHILSFNDAHLMMALVGSKQPEEKINEFIVSLENYVNAKYGNERTTNQKMSEKIGLPLVKAMQSYAKGEYRTATDLLMPIKDHFILIGGSNAQRDVFLQLTIMSAIKAKDGKAARILLDERLAAKPKSPLNARLNSLVQQLPL